jgi:hypothetical protein
VILPALLFASTQTASLTPAKVEEVVSAARDCFEAASTRKVNTAHLKQVGWVEVEPADGKYFRRNGVSARIVAIDNVCSLVSPVASFDDVQAVLLRVDDVVKPKRIDEVQQGILLTNGPRKVLFYVGSPTVKASPAVRIDVTYSESR